MRSILEGQYVTCSNTGAFLIYHTDCYVAILGCSQHVYEFRDLRKQVHVDQTVKGLQFPFKEIRTVISLTQLLVF